MDTVRSRLNQYIYADQQGRDDINIDPGVRADADTLLGKMAFFISKSRTDKEQAKKDKELYLGYQGQVRKTTSLKKTRNIVDAASMEFSDDLKEIGYSAAKRPSLKGLDFLVARLQLGPRLKELDKEKIAKSKKEGGHSRFWRMCYVFACQLVRNDGDVPLIYSGAAGIGKGTQSMKILKQTMMIMRDEFNIDVGGTSYNAIMENNIVYKPTNKDFNDLLDKKHYNFKIIDEGYLTGINLESNTGQAIFIGKITNITRSKNNMLIFCFQNPTRATKFLYEAFYVWICKYSYDYCMVLARTKLFTTTQPWGLKWILKAETEQQIATALAMNSNKAFYLKTSPLKRKVFERYQGKKDDSNEAWKAENEAKEIISQADLKYSMEIYEAAHARIPTVDRESDASIEMFIRKKHPEYGFAKKQIRHIIAKFRDYDFAKVHQIKVKQNEPEKADA